MKSLRSKEREKRSINGQERAREELEGKRVAGGKRDES